MSGLMIKANDILDGNIKYGKAEKFIRSWMCEHLEKNVALEEYSTLNISEKIKMYSILVRCTTNENGSCLSPARYAIAQIASDMKIMSGLRNDLLSHFNLDVLLKKAREVMPSDSDYNERISSKMMECMGCKHKMASKKCSRCLKASYCSIECQKVHWKLEHKSKCTPI